MNIALLLEMAAEAAPDRTALVCEGQRWTYGELLAAAGGAVDVIRESSTTGWPMPIWPGCWAGSRLP